MAGGGGVKYPIHFHCVLHAERVEGVQIECKIAYVLDGRPLCNLKASWIFKIWRVTLGQGGLVVKRPPGNKKVGGSNPTTATW